MTDTKYKLDSIDKIQITAAARKALMAADTHYYAWSAEQQERFRATMDENSRNRVRRALLDSLLGIKCCGKKIDKVWDDIPLHKLNILNWASLLTSGIGEDYIYLNESMAKGESLLDFVTLYDYDYADHLFQEQANQQDFKDYQGSEYYAYKHPSWIRLLIDNQFYYATFLSLATQLTDDIEATGDEFIEQLIPHKYVEGKANGKPEKGGFLWDMQLDAGGQEKQLNELNSRWYSYQQERWLALSKINDKLPPILYTQDKGWDNDPHRCFIFNNQTTLKKIRWRHFLSDCKPLMNDFSVLSVQLEQEINRAKSFLSENHQDIQINFDPNVIKLRKKRKIIMSNQALEDLDKISSEDDPAE